MKKYLMLLLLLLTAFSLIACDTGDTSSPDAGVQGSGKFVVQYRAPGFGDLFTAYGKIVDGAEVIELNSATVKKNEEYWDDRNYSYLGLFTEPNGGTMCYDADGVYVGGDVRSETGIYYVRFNGEEIPITYRDIDDPAAYGLPTSVKYGEPLGITSLPVIEKDGYEFVRWELNSYWGLEVTNSAGVMLGNYLIAKDDYYSGTLSSKSGIYFYPVYEEKKVVYENDITITFSYNDGSQRVVYKEWYSGSKFYSSTYTLSDKTLSTMKGWSLTPDGMTPFEGYLTEDTTLYAIWADRRYICVSTVAGDETLYEVNEGEITVLPTPEREGYIFTGWFTNELRTGLAVSGEVEYSDPYEYYYAGWEKVE